MVFASRSKFFWSKFIATSVKHLGVANTQHLRFLAEKLLPTDMSRQNILYHVRIAEEKGWVATFASSLEMTEDNKQIFRPKFVEQINEKISAQRFIVIGTEPFEPELEDKIIAICSKVHLHPILLTEQKILSLVTDEALNRLSTSTEKTKGNNSLFMVLLRFAWYWLSMSPKYSLKIVEILMNTKDKHNFNESYEIDVKLLEYVSLIEQETIPEVDTLELQQLLNETIKFSQTKKRSDIMNLISMVLLISSRVLIAYNKLYLAEEYLNHGIKYLRFGTRKSILMRKLHVDGLYDLGFIYSQHGWFYKALGVYENIERIISEEFSSNEPVDNLKAKLAHARAELYLMMAWPAYTFNDEDYRSSLLKALKFSRAACKIYSGFSNRLKEAELNLLSAWIAALIGKIPRAEFYLNKGVKGLLAPVPPKLNALYYNTMAEIYRKQEKYDLAIKNISLSFDYLKIVGYLIFKLFSMTRLALMHIQLSSTESNLSVISYGNMTALFEHGISDMISHVFIDLNIQLLEKQAIIIFYIEEEALKKHPELDPNIEIIFSKSFSSVLLGESFSILPVSYLNMEKIGAKKIICLTSTKNTQTIDEEQQLAIFKNELQKFDYVYQSLLSKA